MLMAAAIVGAVMLPLAAQAQGGATTGATAGAIGGAIVAGPVGAVVGGVGGFIVGGISDETRPRFRTYVAQEKRTSYAYGHDVVIGAELPAGGVTYYEVPSEYGVKEYRYTVVNNHAVLVDPRTHRIVQIVD
jgi:hypothetical protein